MISTKEQEQKALDQIKTILATLEPGSYVRTAFDGCVDAAQSNIKNDFGESPYQDCIKAEKRAEAAEEENKTLKAENDKLRACTLSSDELDACESAIIDALSYLVELQNKSAQDIVKWAETPNRVAFSFAVKQHRIAQRELDKYAELKTLINTTKENLNA